MCACLCVCVYCVCVCVRGSYRIFSTPGSHSACLAPSPLLSSSCLSPSPLLSSLSLSRSFSRAVSVDGSRALSFSLVRALSLPLPLSLPLSLSFKQKAAMLMLAGTVLVAFFSDPLVDSVSNFSKVYYHQNIFVRYMNNYHSVVIYLRKAYSYGI